MKNTMSDYMKRLTGQNVVDLQPEDVKPSAEDLKPRSEFFGASVDNFKSLTERALNALRTKESDLVGEIARLNRALNETRVVIRSQESAYKILTERPAPMPKVTPLMEKRE